jgi:hypothetical protein
VAHPSLTFRNWTAEDVEAFQPVAAVEPATGGLLTVHQLLDGCALADYAGRGLLALQLNHYAGGAALHIVGAVTTDERRCSSLTGLRAVEQCAAEAGASVITFQTQHRALANAASRAGWTLGGYILRKRIGGTQ